MPRTVNWWLVTAIVAGLVLRVVWLAKYPAGFTPDEAAFGYNAYSLLQTGRDEWGTPWWQLPATNLRSFGDYKLPEYAFLAIPTVKVLGLTEVAVRLPNALIGTAAIWAVFLLASALFPQNRRLGLVAAWGLALSPWAISLSRGAFEANLVTLFLPLGIYLFLKERYFAAAIVFALNFYSYHSARLLIFPVIIGLVLLKRQKAVWQKFVPLLALLCLPGLLAFFGAGSSRVGDVSIFSPTGGWQAVAERQFADQAAGAPRWLARMFTNKVVYSVTLFTQNYLQYLSPQFLFTNGAGEATYGMIPGRGVLYYFQLPLVIAFLVMLVKKPSRALWWVMGLILLTPLPAALAKGPGFAANRAAAMLPFLMLALGAGAEYLIRTKRDWTILALASVLSFGFFAEDYIYHAPRLNSVSMNYGWKELWSRAEPLAQRYSRVHIGRALSEPHIFVAFYGKVDPQEYQQASHAWTDFNSLGFKFLDQLDGYTLGKYRFGDIHPQDPTDESTLFIGRPDDFPANFPEFFHIDYPTGKTAIKVSENKSP